jgi:hypothetical protein
MDTLVGAVLCTEDWTGGWSGGPEEYTDLISEEIGGQLGPDDRVDLFVPTLFALDGRPTTGLPRGVARSLRQMRAGVTITLADRVICAWNDASWRSPHHSWAVRFDQIRAVVPAAYTEGGANFQGIEIVGAGGWAFPVLFSTAVDLEGIKDLVARRLTGAAQPEWHDGVVAEWRISDAAGGWHRRSGWPAQR